MFTSFHWSRRSRWEGPGRALLSTKDTQRARWLHRGRHTFSGSTAAACEGSWPARGRSYALGFGCDGYPVGWVMERVTDVHDGHDAAVTPRQQHHAQPAGAEEAPHRPSIGGRLLLAARPVLVAAAVGVVVAGIYLAARGDGLAPRSPRAEYGL